ncbi:MAG: GNAT family N-acetyltransferase [Deltaproteobacteria bacterium]|nr:GNAT family N-acetyltransferase [Deltaproteobacteria bacterium]
MAISIEVLAHDAPSHTIECACALLREYGRFVIQAEGAAHFCFGKLQEEIDGLPDTYRNQGGEMLLAYADGQPAGCVTWRAIPGMGGACEMKRLWTRETLRGLNLGEKLVLAAVDHATLAGYNAMYLDTFPGTMRSAFELYLRLGFEPCGPYNDSRYEGIAFMRRPLK